VEGDILAGRPGGPYRVWHDRAVLHFLTRHEQRDAYLAALDSALSADGQVVIATFGPDGPESCNGLPVVRYSPEQLSDTLGPALVLLETRAEIHRTPAGKTQHFIYCRLGRRKRR
jgi:hypothetical protein